MKLTALFTACLCLGGVLSAQESKPAAPLSKALDPVPRSSEKWWTERHEKAVATTKEGKATLAFLGDSITQGWEGQKELWEMEFGAYKPANFGFSGDRTEHVLWRLDNGELIGLKPKLVVMMIGTNNIGHRSTSPTETAAGIRAIVAKLGEKLPETKVLVLAIFPRSDRPAFGEQVKEVNAKIRDIADGKRVHFMDIGEKFLQPDGTLTKEIAPDLLHLSPRGYSIWASSIKAKVAELMK